MPRNEENKMNQLQTVLDALENGIKVRNYEGGTRYQPPLEEKAIAIVKQMMQVEPVAYEFRMFPEGATASGAWSPCSKEHHEMYIRTPMFENWVYETRALFAAPQAVPAGFVLVPVEPTQKQLKAAMDCSAKLAIPSGKDYYRAMLAAAPKGVV
jgi:hypothetical protein